MVDWWIFVASGECPIACLVITTLTIISASKLQDGVDATLIAEMKAPNQYIICHVMCDDIGEFRSPVPTSFANTA